MDDVVVECLEGEGIWQPVWADPRPRELFIDQSTFERGPCRIGNHGPWRVQVIVQEGPRSWGVFEVEGGQIITLP